MISNIAPISFLDTRSLRSTCIDTVCMPSFARTIFFSLRGGSAKLTLYGLQGLYLNPWISSPHTWINGPVRATLSQSMGEIFHQSAI